MNAEELIGFEIGQSEPLTVRLRDLVRSYPKGISIFKEFIQNADDGGAQRVEILLDLRQHPSDNIPAQSMQCLMGPALLIVNNEPFSEDDWKAIQTIGQSGKAREVLKTGRFGHGFNVAYNVTDYPSFLTGDRVAIFDPHQNVVPQTRGGTSKGRGWKLSELWKSYPDFPCCYLAGGLQQGDAFFNGTIFRLPLRTSQQAEASQICKDPFVRADFYRLLSQFKKSAAELLLFLKNVLTVTVGEIDETGAHRKLIQVETINEHDVKNARGPINDALRNGLAQLEKTAADKRQPPTVTYQHDFTITIGNRTTDESWRIASGLYIDVAGQVLKTAQEMLSFGEKAIPWAGAACRTSGKSSSKLVVQSVRGQVFCGLPLPQNTSLPVHIHGFFDLDSSRQAITSDPTLVGRDGVRRRWNELLCSHAVPRAYAQLLTNLVKDAASGDPAAFYGLWPHVSEQSGDLFQLLSRAVYKELEPCAVIRSTIASVPIWFRIGDITILPSKWKTLHAPLQADGVALPRPVLPKQVLEGFQRAGVKIVAVTPQSVRERLRTKKDVGLFPKDVTRLCLQKPEWIKALLHFCTEDGQHDLAGLPLALLSDGKLHTFGYNGAGSIFIANTRERRIFQNRPHWFISEDFQREFKFQNSAAAKLHNMTPVLVIANLKTFFPENVGSTIAWQPENSEDPNNEWLQAVYEYLCDESVFREIDNANLKKFPLVPDQFHVLHTFGTTGTPLLTGSIGGSDALARALEVFKVPVVWGSASLVDAISRFATLHPEKFVWPLTGPDLVDSLSANESAWVDGLTRYQSDVHDVLWDFLSDSQWHDKYSAKQLERLRSLRIFATQNKNLMRGTDKGIFLPSNFSAPPTIGPDCLLRVGKNGRWRELLLSTGIPQLDRATLILDLLLPKYETLNPQQQYEVLEWIRDNLSAAQTQVERDDPDQAEALLSAVASHDLVRCSDGELRAACSIYHPARMESVKEILGERAVFPDMTVYRHGQKHWLDFFVTLDMSEQIRPVDLLRYLDDVIDASDNSTHDRLGLAARVILDHLGSRWDNELAETEVNDPKTGKVLTFKEALRIRTWIPAERNESRLARYVSYSIPPNKLYRPTEIFLPRRGFLVATEFPIADLQREPARGLYDAMGFRHVVKTEVVLRQFDGVLAVAQSRKKDVPPDVLERCLGEIYRYLGQLQTGADDSADQSAELLSEADVEEIRTRYSDQPCLWNPKTKNFWLPKRVFDDPVPFLEPRRTCIRAKGNEDRGYKLLGRRSHPTSEDYVDFLVELTKEFEDTPLLDQETASALHALKQLADTTATLEADNVFVLTTTNRLVRVDSCYVDDAPWYQGKLDTSCADFLHHEVPQALGVKLGISRLSESITEKIIGTPVESTLPSFVETMARIETTITSEEFQGGLHRLIRNKQGFIYAGETDWLRNVGLVAVDRIAAELWLDGTIFAGEYETECFWDSTSSEFYVSESAGPLTSHVLAEDINRNLSEAARLTNLSPLVAIIDCPPNQIQFRLDRLKIPIFEDSSTTDEDAPDTNSEEFVFPEPDFEAMPTEQEQEQRPASDTRVEVDKDAEPRTAAAAAAATPLDSHRQAEIAEPTAGQSQGQSVPDQRTAQHPNQAGPSSPTGARAISREPQQRHQQERKQQRLLSYVVPDSRRDVKEPRDPDDDDQAENMVIGQAAVQRVIEYEKSYGRDAVSMPHTNPGFDVKSLNKESGETRWIEVKGTAGAWSVTGVPVSPTQFRFGWTHPGDFWLYVVEFATDPSRTRIYPIRNAINRITQFRFDAGWKQASENENDGPSSPKEGMLVTLADGKRGQIINVIQHGKLYRITIRYGDQSESTEIFNPTDMFLSES